jgi:hypothetical protein
MEAIYDKVMYHDYPDYEYLDFGSSTEDNCSVINEGLISQRGIRRQRCCIRYL